MKILLIEDEPLLVESLVQNLQKADFIVDSVSNGEDALHLLTEFTYDCIILDLGLPKLPGLVVLERFRAQNKQTPVLILTARNSWQDRVTGLKLGADDYLGKPFHFEELLARIEVLLKRNAPDRSFEITHNECTLNTQTRILTTPTQTYNLTKTEYRLLKLFFTQPNQVLSKETLIERITDQHSETGSNIIEVYVRKLRLMMGKDAIETLRGQGYRLTQNTDVSK